MSLSLSLLLPLSLKSINISLGEYFFKKRIYLPILGKSPLLLFALCLSFLIHDTGIKTSTRNHLSELSWGINELTTGKCLDSAQRTVGSVFSHCYYWHFLRLRCGPRQLPGEGKTHSAGVLELNFKAPIKVFQPFSLADPCPWSWLAINQKQRMPSPGWYGPVGWSLIL